MGGHNGQRVYSWRNHPNLQFINNLTIACNITNIFLSISFHWSHDLAQNWTFFPDKKRCLHIFFLHQLLEYTHRLNKVVSNNLFLGEGGRVKREICWFWTLLPYQNLNAFFFHRSSVISSFTHSYHCGNTVFLKFLGSEKRNAVKVN